MRARRDHVIFVPLGDGAHAAAEPEVLSSKPQPEPEAESTDGAPEPVEVPEVGSAPAGAAGNVPPLMTLACSFSDY